MYFETKFNKAFTAMLLHQEPKGGSVKVNDKKNSFWRFEQLQIDGKQANHVVVQPLLMFNSIYSTNTTDINIQDQEMVCTNLADTTVTAEWDKNKDEDPLQNYVCDFGIKLTGDTLCDITFGADGKTEDEILAEQEEASKSSGE